MCKKEHPENLTKGFARCVFVKREMNSRKTKTAPVRGSIWPFPNGKGRERSEVAFPDDENRQGVRFHLLNTRGIQHPRNNKTEHKKTLKKD